MLLLLPFWMMLASAMQQPAIGDIRVPKGGPVAIDGRLSAGEWDRAFRADLNDGSQVLLQHDADYLYLAVRSTTDGYPSVCVSRGDTVHVLHASAALASAVFVRAGSSWSLGRGFSPFALRSSDIGPAGKAAQAEYLKANSWVASNFAMSQRDHEMQIALSFFDAADKRLALAMYKEPDGVDRWPANANDGCTSKGVVQGPLPKEPISIVRDQWARITLVP